MKKVFVLDTNVLLVNPLSLFKFDDNDVVIPISVIEEVDTFKQAMSETGRNAREVSRILDRLRERGSLSTGIKLFPEREDSGSLFVHLGNTEGILPKHLADNVDNQILAIAFKIQASEADRKVIIITKDANLRIKADAFGVMAEDFSGDKVADISHLYSGIATIKVTSDTINNFYSKQELAIEDLDGVELCPNQFVILQDDSDENISVTGIYDVTDGVIRLLNNRSEGVWGIYPRNLEQMFALEVLMDDNIQLVTLTGGAGTGKTLMALAAGLSKTTDDDEYQKLLVSRPIFPLGKDVGFLPGDIEEKMNPWMQPIYDNLELLLSGGVTSSKQKRFSKSHQELITQGMLAVEPLTYIRGRSIPNQYFIVDEAQNLTPHEIKTILSRAGEGTKIILTGDPHQIDNPYIDAENNGLTYVIERFRNEKIAAHVTLTQGERSALATLAASLL